jgi:hypothetical protein
MLHGMTTDSMNPATAVTWGPFIQAAYEQFVSHPGEVNPPAIKNMPAGYTLVRTIQMTDFFGPVQTRVFYGFVAVGGDPKTAVVALRGTGKAHWSLGCAHALNTYLHVLSPATVPLDPACRPGS